MPRSTPTSFPESLLTARTTPVRLPFFYPRPDRPDGALSEKCAQPADVALSSCGVNFMNHLFRQLDVRLNEGECLKPCSLCEVRATGVCGSVSSADLIHLAPMATIVDIDRGQTFIREGSPAEYYFTVIYGSAKLYKILADGRRQIIGFAYVGNFLGLASEENSRFSAEALEPLRVCRIARTRLTPVLVRVRSMEQRFLGLAIEELSDAHDQMALLGRKTTAERMASFILLQARRPQPRGVKFPRIHLPMSRVDIADYLGVTIETVSRSLARLKKLGVIEVPNIHEIVILDDARLRAISGGLFDPTTIYDSRTS